MSEPKIEASILIGTPAFGGQVATTYMHSFTKLQSACQQLGISLGLALIAKESLIQRARNTIVAGFLAKPSHTHLLFIDGDIGFEPKMVFRLLQANKPLIGGIYPFKKIDYAKLGKKLRDGMTEADLRKAMTSFAVNVFDEDRPAPTGSGERATLAISNGYAQVSKLANGFMMIRRDCLDQMVKAYPDRAYVNDMPEYNDAAGHFYDLFSTFPHPISRRYLSEDYGFCHLWQKLGGEVWADLTSRLSHFGPYLFEGSYMDECQIIPKKPVDKLDVV